MEALKAGLPNLGRHLQNLKKYNLQPVVAVNRFPTDTPEQLEVVKSYCKELGFEAAVADVFAQGGAGAIELAEKVVAAAEKADPTKVQPLYTPEMNFEEKIKRVATEIYGAGKVVIEDSAKKKLARFSELGYGHFPVCMAKTQYSFSDNPKLLGAPTGHTFTVTDANLSAGAGFVVPIGGNMMLMPGLGKVPQAVKMDVDDAGNIVGM